MHSEPRCICVICVTAWRRSEVAACGYQVVTLNDHDLRHARVLLIARAIGAEMRADVQQRLFEIRGQMLAAQLRNDCAEYYRLGAEHRGILHVASAETDRAWQKARAAMDTVA